MEKNIDWDSIIVPSCHGHFFSRKADTGKSVSKRRRFGAGCGSCEEEYGLNDPLIEQYLSYMGNLLKGDLGISYQDPGTSVEEIIGRAAPLTVSLGLSALIVPVIVGTGCGVFYAASEKRAMKKVIGSGMLAAGIPGFAAAILLLMVFSVKLKWFLSGSVYFLFHIIFYRLRHCRFIRRL